MRKKDNMIEKDYMEEMLSYGRKWNLSIIALLIIAPFIVCIAYGAKPDPTGLWKGLLATAPMYYAVAIIEVFTYFPMLGVGGSYLSFVSGNIANLKLPCALNALQQMDVEADSEEGEVVSTIAIAVSSIVTSIIIVIGVILIRPLTPLLESPVLEPAFEQMVPALFGGLGIVFISKNVKLSILPLILMTVAFVTVPALNASTVGIMVPVGVVFTILEAKIMHKKGWI